MAVSRAQYKTINIVGVFLHVGEGSGRPAAQIKKTANRSAIFSLPYLPDTPALAVHTRCPHPSLPILDGYKVHILVKFVKYEKLP
jgi:hypothetical protein